MNDPRLQFQPVVVVRDLEELCALVADASRHCHPLRPTGKLPGSAPGDDDDPATGPVFAPAPESLPLFEEAREVTSRRTPPPAPPELSHAEPDFDDDDLEFTWGDPFDDEDEPPAPPIETAPRPISSEPEPALEIDVDASDLDASASPIERYLAKRGMTLPESAEDDDEVSTPDPEPAPPMTSAPRRPHREREFEPEPLDQGDPEPVARIAIESLETPQAPVESDDLISNPIEDDPEPPKIRSLASSSSRARRSSRAQRRAKVETSTIRNLAAPGRPASPPRSEKTKQDDIAVAPAALFKYRGTLVSLAELTTRFEHDAADLTLTCDAGWPLETLDAHLAHAGQRLPFEYPTDLGLTLGAAVAEGIEGFNACLFGPLRDQVLGIGYVDGRGRLARCGGRVVKNVTGYDLVRLHTGAGGRFGIIHEVTLRLRPLAPATATFLFPGEELEAAHELALALREIGAKVSALVILTGSVVAPGLGDYVTALRVEGHAETLDSCRQWLNTAPPFIELPTADAVSFWQGLLRWPSRQGFAHALRLRPSQLLPAAKEFAPGHLRDGAALIVDVGNSALTFTEEESPENLEERIRELGLSELAERHAGAPSMPHDPFDRSRRRERFGAPSSAMKVVLDRLTMALDPAGIFDPRATDEVTRP